MKNEFEEYIKKYKKEESAYEDYVWCKWLNHKYLLSFAYHMEQKKISESTGVV